MRKKNKKLQYMKALERAVESILIHWELVYPRIYALLISLGLTILGLVVAYAFYKADPVIGIGVGIINLFLAMLVSWFVNTVADLVIVKLSSDINKHKISNMGIATELCMRYLGKYILTLVPISVVRSLVVFVAILPLLLPIILAFFAIGMTSGAEATDTVSGASRSATRFITTAIDFLFQFLFVFIAQIVLFEKLDVIGSLKKSINLALKNAKELAFYILFRYVAGAFFGILLTLTILAFVLIGGIPSFLAYSIGYTTAASALIGVFILIGIIGAVIGTMTIASGLLVLDTDFYFQLRK